MDKSNTMINQVLALSVFLISSAVYIMTMSPTIPLWDCGEYLASSGCLGIPHPPGTPLLVMLGRVFDMALPFIGDHGYRLNLITALSSALVAMFIYLIVVRVLIMIVGQPDTRAKQLAIFVGGFAGGLLCAFSNTFWFEALEFSEQSNVCLLPNVLTVWLMLIWAQSKDIHRDKWLILVAYIGFAGVGLHMISMITLPVVFLFVMLVDKAKLTDWRLWVVGLVLSTVMFNLSWFMIACPIVTVGSGLMALAQKRSRSKWLFCFMFSVVGIIGFSNHLYMPIRSALNPAVDMNHPVTWQTLTDALDRKQYGSESMVTRSFWRRGTLAHQFGIEGHMGYGGFHITQFFHFSKQDTEKNFLAEDPTSGFFKLLIYLIPTALMFFGWFYCYKRNRQLAIFLIGATLLTTLVLAWYMNFSDGTHPEKRDYQEWVRAGKPGPMPVVYREVRVRDYFYSAGFMFFAMWLGIAAGGIIAALSTSKSPLLRTTVMPFVAILFAVAPALPLTQNYPLRDRHNTWLPYDYAYNLLMSCEQNAVIFTNGDNDTYPIWAIQEAFGVRKDVRLANLSLLNTNWYVKQLKNVGSKIPISFSDAEIDHLQAEYNPFTTPTPYRLSDAGIDVTIPSRQELNALRVQDKMILNIVNANRWTKPIYFASTVSEDNFMGLGPYLQVQGMVLKVMPKPVSADERIDFNRTAFLIDSVYRFRNLQGPGVSLDEAARGLSANYAGMFMQFAFMMRDPMAREKAALEQIQKNMAAAKPALQAALADSLKVKQTNIDQMAARTTGVLNKCISILPDDWRPRALLQEVLIENGKLKEAEQAARDAVKSDPANAKYQQMLAQVLGIQGKRE